MAPHVAPGLERLVDNYLPVPAGQVDAEFDRIWRETAAAGHDASSVRLHISNFVAWGDEPDAGPRFERVMEELPQRHPCRAILAVLAPDAKGTESAISARCWRGAGGGRQICSEEILLRAVPRDDGALASAVLALVLPELPVNVWLVGSPDPASRLPEELVAIADRVILDSANADVPGLAIAQLAAAADLDAYCEDLAWHRTAVWRELAAQFFDDEAAAAELAGLTQIVVAGGAGSISTAAMLMGGWLAAQLRLSPASVEAASTMTRATFYAGARAVEVRLTPAPHGSELEALTMESARASFRIEQHHESGHMHVSSDLASRPVDRVVDPGPVDDASMIEAAVEHSGTTEVFLRALQAAKAFTGS